MNVFEDAGYFCVDNLPAEMIRSLAELFRHPGSKVERAAVVCDSRGGEYLSALAGVIDELAETDVPFRVVYLEADEQTLIDRYKETRRRHPLAPQGNVADGIHAEMALLAPGQGARRPVHRHLRPERRGAAPQGRRTSCSSRPTRASSRSRSRPSGTSTARRATPTSRSTCASCPTRTTSPTCGR